MVDNTCNQTQKAEDHHELEVSLGYSMSLSQTNEQTNPTQQQSVLEMSGRKGHFELCP